MKTIILALFASLAMHQTASAQGAGTGQEVFGHYCAACHGAEARGDGPMAPILLLKPANLRRLSALNDGVFPTARVVMRIDGRDPLVAHGALMPVYGNVFEGEDTPLKAESGQPIMTSRIIVDLVEYLEGLQE
ncbi:MAG: cytochrome c [Sulfitobacter sp.]